MLHLLLFQDHFSSLGSLEILCEFENRFFSFYKKCHVEVPGPGIAAVATPDSSDHCSRCPGEEQTRASTVTQATIDELTHCPTVGILALGF